MFKQIINIFLIASLLISSFGFFLPSVFAQEDQNQPDCLVYFFTETDISGTIVKSDNYDPFGNIRNSTGTVNNNYQFSSEQLDPETGLYFLRARYYDPKVGRFISRDPVKGVLTNPQTQNPYAYALNNPVNLSDPSGKFVGQLLQKCAEFFCGDGDCMNEARYLGKIGEIASGISKNTKQIPSLTNTANYRVPDVLEKTGETIVSIGEVKNVSNLSMTNQMQDFILAAQKAGVSLELWVRETTNLSKPLETLVETGQIIKNILQF